MKYAILFLFLSACAVPNGTAPKTVTAPTKEPLTIDPSPTPTATPLASPTPLPTATPSPTPSPSPTPVVLTCTKSGSTALCVNGNLVAGQTVQWSPGSSFANVSVTNVLNQSNQVCIIYSASLGASNLTGQIACGADINAVTGVFQ